jgi:eukaryotic-like serine/threonine-protein kinase
MTTPADDAARDPLDLLSEQFLRRRRAGEKLTVEQFVAAHPEHQGALVDLLPTLLLLEDVKRERSSSGSGQRRIALPDIERLGEFRIVREIGRGGMGVVFEAVQESLGRKVALKVLPQASLLTGNQLERFRREAQVASQLHHSNIVPVFGSGENDGYHWYAMQFIQGQGLDRWLAEQRGTLPVGTGAWRARARFVARVGAAAAGALHAAHQAGTLHRDIKPANLLLDRNDHVWVTDFGLAKALEAEGLTHSGDILGTLQYMAPEQFAGGYDARSEVYALGVTLYELLACRQAFTGKGKSEVMEQVRGQRFERLQRLCPEAPRDLVVVIEKAMAREPADRYRDAEALQHDLDAFVEDRPIAARPLSALAHVARWCRRNRGMAALAASTLLAVVGAGVTGWVAYGITDEARRTAEDARGRAEQSAAAEAAQAARAESNLRLFLSAFGDLFDTLVGRDPAVAVDEDPDTGESALLVRAAIGPRDLVLVQQMLASYEQFAEANRESQSLRLETARAYRRVGTIHARLGGPDNLDAADAALQQALTRFRDVQERDTRREQAGVVAELGRVQLRRAQFEPAAERFREAIGLLEAAPSAESRGVRTERAEVQLELARCLELRPMRSREGRVELRRALELVDGLLAEQPDDPEVRALKARGLVDLARVSRRRPEGPGERPPPGERPQPPGERPPPPADDDPSLAEAVGILRELTRAHPAREDFAYEFCEAALAQARGAPVPGRRPPRRPSAEDLALLQEAAAVAARLHREQPLFVEYRALAGRATTAVGLAQLALGRGADPAARPLRAAATATLGEALALELPLLAGEGPSDPRFVRQVVETQAGLMLAHTSVGEQAAAAAAARAAFDAIERQIAASEGAAADVAPRPPGWSLWRVRALGGIDPRALQTLEEVVRRIDDPELQARLGTLRERLRPRGR